MLVSFSTTWQRQIDALQEVIDTLASLELPVAVTTGPAVDPSELRPAGNTIVLSEVPHHQILDRVAVIITHAGHGTVLAALTAGVPVVAVPLGRDQHDVARQVVVVGAGVTVERDHVRRDLLAVVEQIPTDPDVVERAAAISDSIAAHGGVAAALAIIDRSAITDPHDRRA